MLSLGDCRYAFIAVGLIGVLVFNVPSLMLFVHLPGGELFSELYVLGPGHMAEEYPFNVNASGNYLVYLGVGNHLGSAVYYEVVVKLRNSSEALPNATSGVESPLPVLYIYSVFLTDGQTWEGTLNLSFSNVTSRENVSSVGMIAVNDAWTNMDKSAIWDDVNNEYFYQLIAELWLYDAASSSIGFNGRFVTLSLNMTAGS